MASRVNTKFVIALTAVIVLLVAGMGVVYVKFINKSAAQVSRQADKYLDQGEILLAYETYGKAISKDRKNPKYVQKLLDTIEKIECKDIIDARKYLGQKLECLRLLTELNPGDTTRQKDFYEFMMTLSRDLHSTYYNSLYQRTDTRIKDYPNDLMARRYRGVAGVNLLKRDMNKEDRATPLEDLQTYDSENPDDALVLNHMARWNLFEADLLDVTGGQPVVAERLREEAVEISEASLAVEPDDPDRLLQHVRILLNPNLLTNNPSEAIDQFDLRRAEAAPLLKKLENRVLDNPDPEHLVVGVANAMVNADTDEVQLTDARKTTRGMQRARTVFEAAEQAHPANLLYVVVHGDLLKRQGENDKAIELFQKARNMGASGDPIELMRNQNLLATAAVEAANLLLIDAAQSKGDAKRQAQLFDQVQGIVEEVTNNYGRSARVDKLEGQLMLARGKYQQAAVLLDKASDQFRDMNLETLLLSSQARRLSGNWGAAAERLEQIIERQPEQTILMLHLAEIRLEHRQVGEAEALIEQVLEREPNNEKAHILHASLLTQREQYADAIRIYERIDFEQYPQVVNALAQLYVKEGEKEKAMELIEEQRAKNPDDMRLIGLLVNLTEDPEQKSLILQTARDAGAEGSVVDLIERTVSIEGGDSDLSVDELADLVAERQEDPAMAALARATVYHRGGELEKAKAAVAEAVKQDPNHADVIEFQFVYAIVDGDFDAAESIVARAIQLNIDLAEGEFYRGRLAMARKESEQAASAFRRALAARPIYASGWRLLGDALTMDQKFTEALEAYTRAAEQKPDDVESLRGLARVKLATGDPRGALEDMRTARRYRPDDPQVVQQYLVLEQEYGEAEVAAELRRKMLAKNPENTANRRNLAILLARTDDPEALDIADQLIAEAGPTRPNIGTKATVMRLMGDGDGGRRVIEEYIEGRGDEVEATDYAVMARYMIASEDDAGAFEAYRQGIELEDTTNRPISREYGDLMFSRGMYEASAAVYEELHEADASDDRITLRLAENLMRLGRVDEGSSLLDDIEPTTESLILRAMIANHRGDSEAALRLLNQAIRRTQNRADLYYQRALLLAMDPDKLAQAEADVRRVIELDENHPQARELHASLLARIGDTVATMQQLRALLDDKPENISVRVRLINLYRQEDKNHMARALIDDAIKLFPSDSRWVKLRANQAVIEDDWDEAIEWAAQLTEVAPTPSSIGYMINILLQAGRPEEALESLRDNVELVNREPVFQALRARALSAIGQEDSARQVILKAFERCRTYDQTQTVATQAGMALGEDKVYPVMMEVAEPFDKTAFIMIGAQMHIGAGFGKGMSEKVRELEPSISPDNKTRYTQYRQLLANALHHDGDPEHARKIYEELLDEDPNDLNALNNLAFLLANDLGQPEDALPKALYALELAPNNPRVLDTVGWVQFKAGNAADARMTLERSKALEPMAENHLHLAAVYEYLGIPDRARDLYTKSIELARKVGDRRTQRLADEALKKLDQ